MTTFNSTTSCIASLTQPLRSEPIGYINISRPIPYDIGLKLQQSLVQRRHELTHQLKTGNSSLDKNTPLDIVLFLQHTPTFTAGRRIRGDIQEEQRLKASGADYVETMRGGQVTFHGPGQLVAYPILDIRDYQLSVRCYVSRLEKTIIDTCASFGIQANTTENTGVWVGQDHKIAALGVHLQRYVSSHGVALNCDVDLNWYKQIVPCGLPDKKVTSLSDQLNRQVSVSETVPVLIRSFETLFSKQLVPIKLNELDPLLHDYL
ncbi:mitochondrial putative lipoyltransferase 2 [Halteromyces radiatus]|uniref:mitochondrial putative lipoyltransferase 2 n=1 Tax=Halteromyces radiatus TaxID=101107 RepID=UPI00221F169E|nr:mitochondrial putative lipoyltransferase 2 [Halteromyces radiatus]KAI8084700.1 mitochondrial putative lipoyltransferase 2 [Halteromyces radiatus]